MLLCIKINFNRNEFLITTLCSKAAETLKNILSIFLITPNTNIVNIRNENLMSNRIKILLRKYIHLRTTVGTGTSALALDMLYLATENTH